LWLLLAGGRVLTGSHFVSDVLAGGAVGIAVAVAVSRWDWLTARSTELTRRMRTAPAAVPSSPVRDE
jgi:membrane-associated phospholipid phosphatase